MGKPLLALCCAFALVAAAAATPRGGAAKPPVQYAAPHLLLKSTTADSATLELCAGADGAPKGFALQACAHALAAFICLSVSAAFPSNTPAARQTWASTQPHML